MTQQKTKVKFLYRAGHVNQGAKIMRCDQLCEIANQFLAEAYEFEAMALPRPGQFRKQRELVETLKGSIIIFLKRADRAIEPTILEELRQSVRGMAIDYVDAAMLPWADVPMDVHFCASFTAKKTLDVMLNGPFGPPINARTSAQLVLHHADPRLKPVSRSNEKMAMGYFGKPSNAFMTESISKLVSDTNREADPEGRFLQGIERYDLHYCVRKVANSNPKLAIKPFTKVFNAAACGANVLINKQVPDAIDLLGKDYPFMVEDATEAQVIWGLKRAADAFGTVVWNNALDRMGHIRSQIEPKKIALQLNNALQNML